MTKSNADHDDRCFTNCNYTRNLQLLQIYKFLVVYKWHSHRYTSNIFNVLSFSQLSFWFHQNSSLRQLKIISLNLSLVYIVTMSSVYCRNSLGSCFTNVSFNNITWINSRTRIKSIGPRHNYMGKNPYRQQHQTSIFDVMGTELKMRSRFKCS